MYRKVVEKLRHPGIAVHLHHRKMCSGDARVRIRDILPTDKELPFQNLLRFLGHPAPAVALLRSASPKNPFSLHEKLLLRPARKESDVLL